MRIPNVFLCCSIDIVDFAMFFNAFSHTGMGWGARCSLATNLRDDEEGRAAEVVIDDELEVEVDEVEGRSRKRVQHHSVCKLPKKYIITVRLDGSVTFQLIY